MTIHRRRAPGAILGAALAFALLPAGAAAQPAGPGSGPTTCPASSVEWPAALQELRTTSERAGLTCHTSYADMVAYLGAVQARSTEMRLASFGRTWEGRELPFAIFSRHGITRPEEALATGMPILVLAANVHGGERTLRESVLIVTRELATPGSEMNGLLDRMIVLVVPSLNPDGFEASERGTRGNAWGIDMNRDYIKLEMPAIAQYVGNILNRWHPHLFIDGHNGGAYPYNVAYQCASIAAADQRLTELCDREIFPFIDRQMAEHGYKSWYYASGTATRWNTGGSEARIGRNYGGLANSVGILYESPGGQTLETGVQSGVVAYKAVLRFARDQPDRLLSVVNNARAETIALGMRAEGDVPVRMRYDPEPYRVTYEIAVGEGADRRLVTVESDSLMKRPVPTLSRPRPFAYLLPRDAVDAVSMLRRHNITVDVLREAVELDVDAYVLSDITYEQAYNHAAATRVETNGTVTVRRTFPAGTYVVRTGQLLGRVVTHMLEPETPDNVVYWNTFDAWLPKPALQPQLAGTNGAAPGAPARGAGGATGGRGAGTADEPPLIPIFKLEQPRPLPTRLLP
jgi:dipeptidyl-peptidase 4